MKRRRWLSAWSLVVVAISLSCGPEGPGLVEPETWMIGTFSAGRLGCDTAGYTVRYEVWEDGTFIFINHLGSSDPEAGLTMWPARWEQRAPGQYRIMRDEDYTHLDFYPIQEGTEWEVVRSSVCEEYGQLWHRGFVVDLETGDREPVTSMTPGAMCTIIPDMEGQCWPDYEVVWCDGSEPPPPCEDE